MEKNTMKIVKVEPGKKAEIAEIANDLEAMQALVGGNIECIFWHDGPFFIAGVEGDGFTGLSDEQAEEFRAIYEKPEMFFRLGGGLCMQYMEA